MPEHGRTIRAEPSARSVGALVREMSRVLQQPFGDDAVREARELLAAIHDMPRHWATVEQEQTIGEEDWVRDAGAALEPRGLLALEVDVRRASVVAELVATDGAFDQVQVVLDLTGRERFVVARRRGTE